MSIGVLGRKVGMTQVFEDSEVVPVTVIKVNPGVVVQKKTEDNDGYNSIQIGAEDIPERLVKKPIMGHFKKAGITPKRILKEFRVDSVDEYNIGDVIGIDLFKPGEYVDITGISKGKGFAGVIKRHGFKGGRMSHGSMFHRAPGSIGQSSQPSRTLKGTRLPGRMGNKKVTVQNLRIVKIDDKENLLIVKGAVPGRRNGLLIIKKAVKK